MSRRCAVSGDWFRYHHLLQAIVINRALRLVKIEESVFTGLAALARKQTLATKQHEMGDTNGATSPDTCRSGPRMKSRGADPPGRSKGVDDMDQELLPPENAERRSRSRGRSMGRSTSNRSLRRVTGSRSLGRSTTSSRSSRSLVASKNGERSKSLSRAERGRSKSRGRSELKPTDDERRSKSRGRTERAGAREKERSKSRGRLEQKKAERPKIFSKSKSSSQDENQENLTENLRMNKTSANPSHVPQLSPAAAAVENLPRNGSNRLSCPSVEKLDTPLVPPHRHVTPLPTTPHEQDTTRSPIDAEKQLVLASPPTINRVVARSVSAQAERQTTGKSPKRSKSTDEIQHALRPTRSATSVHPLSKKERAIPMVPTNTLPRLPPSKADTPDRVVLLREAQSFEEDRLQPSSRTIEANAVAEKKVRNESENVKMSLSETSKNSTNTLIINRMEGHDARPFQPKPDPHPRSPEKLGIPAMTMVASASLFVTILEGRMLLPMQRNMLGIRRYSHPFVETYLDNELLGKTINAQRTINPVWKSGNTSSYHFDGAKAKEMVSRNEEIELRVYHSGKGGVPMFMGAAHVPLLTGNKAEWYPVEQQSVSDKNLFCANASGELKVHVDFTAHSYPDLKPGHELSIAPKSEISLNFTWSGNPSLETSCVALDRKNGHVLWKECVYFANRINLSNSVARPEAQGQDEQLLQDSLMFDLGMVPETVAAFYVILTMRDRSSTLSDIRSFQAIVRNELTHEGMGRLTAQFPSKDSAAVLLRIARSTRGSIDSWKLATVVKGFKVFREFGSLLPQLQELSSDILPFIGTPAERTALMRCGDCVQLTDYVASPIPSRLVIGFFWKVNNKEPLKVAASLLDEQLREIDAFHRTQPGSPAQGVQYSGGNDDFEKYEISISQIPLNAHYICFVLGPRIRQKVDDIQNVACHIVNPTKGAELARCTLSNFESVPTKSVGLGCFYRVGKEWNFTILGLSSSDPTFAGRLNDIRTQVFHNPLEAATSLPHPRLLKSVMPSPIPLPPPRNLSLSDAL